MDNQPTTRFAAVIITILLTPALSRLVPRHRRVACDGGRQFVSIQQARVRQRLHSKIIAWQHLNTRQGIIDNFHDEITRIITTPEEKWPTGKGMPHTA